MSFDYLVLDVFDREGGFVDHPHDRGGPTNLGITQQTYNAYRSERALPLQSVEKLTKEEASGIYLSKYWVPAHCDSVPERLCGIHFDSAVNHGVVRAIKFLQNAVGAKEDGVCGPQTKAAMGQLDVELIYARYKNARYRFYTQIISRDPSQKVFIAGWLNRMMEFA